MRGKLLRKKSQILYVCSSSSATGTTLSGITNTRENYIEDICCVEDSDEPLIITTHSLKRRLCAYNSRSNEREWVVKGKDMQGVTTDRRGHLFVCNSDKGCVQVYSTDGRCLGVLISEGDGGLGKPMKIRWHERTRSAVIAHLIRNIWHISSVRVDLWRTNLQANSCARYVMMTSEFWTSYFSVIV